jgi:tetratricopeptide (TPR) repeat protein
MLAEANRSHGTNAVALETYREALRVARKVDAKNPGCYPLAVTVGGPLRFWCDESYKPACELLVHVERAENEALGRMQKEGCGAGKSKVDAKPVRRRWTAALEALELAKKGDLKEAETFARIEVELSEGLWDPLENVEAHLVLAHVLSLQGKHTSAMEELDKALQQTERREVEGGKLRPGGELRAHVLLHIAAAKRMAGGVELERAKSALQSALRLCDISGEDAAKEYLRRSCAEGCPAACSLASD